MLCKFVHTPCLCVFYGYCSTCLPYSLLYSLTQPAPISVYCLSSILRLCPLPSLSICFCVSFSILMFSRTYKFYHYTTKSFQSFQFITCPYLRIIALFKSLFSVSKLINNFKRNKDNMKPIVHISKRNSKQLWNCKTYFKKPSLISGFRDR